MLSEIDQKLLQVAYDEAKAGFLEGGWDTIMEGVVLKSPTPKPPEASLPGLSLDAFRQSVVPTLTHGDFVVLVLHGNKPSESLKRDGIMLQKKPCQERAMKA